MRLLSATVARYKDTHTHSRSPRIICPLSLGPAQSWGQSVAERGADCTAALFLSAARVGCSDSTALIYDSFKHTQPADITGLCVPNSRDWLSCLSCFFFSVIFLSSMKGVRPQRKQPAVCLCTVSSSPLSCICIPLLGNWIPSLPVRLSLGINRHFVCYCNLAINSDIPKSLQWVFVLPYFHGITSSNTMENV